MRIVTHLNHHWKYTSSWFPEMTDPQYEAESLKTVHLPHTNIELPFSCFDEKMSQFVCGYRNTFSLPPHEPGRRVLLFFEGAMTAAEVYLNGEFVGSHLGGYTPFRIDATAVARFGKDNVLAVRLDATERADIPPFGNVVDYLPYGGLYREVRVECVGGVSLANLRIIPHCEAEDTGLAEVSLFWENTTGTAQTVRILGTLSFLDQQVSVLNESFEVSAENTSVSIHPFKVANVQRWDVDAPNLYDLRILIASPEKSRGEIVVDPEEIPVLDSYETRFGFREATFRADGFYLNGSPLKLRGLNRHQSFPHVGNAMPKRIQQKDADILKHELGLNLVRSSHYPPSPHFLDRCDEIGLLVFEEIPGWQHIGDDAWKEVSKKNCEEMIRRDWNHPSVILWGVRINESQDDDAFYEATNRLAHELDPTRQTGGVRNFGGSHLFEDVYTVNDFIHHGDNAPLQPPDRVSRQKKKPSAKPGKAPYLVTEHNGHMFPTKVTDPEYKRTEHAMRHMRVLDAMYANPRISGAVGWCMADYNTHKDFGSGDRVCHHGVLDMYRLPKTAAAVYASQQEGTPVMEVSSSMDIGEHAAASLSEVKVFTNCDEIKLYKNGEEVGLFSPDRKTFPAVPHPPVIIQDFIGGLMARNEDMSEQNAEALKRIIQAIMKKGHAFLPFRLKLALGWQMFRQKLSYPQAVSLFMKYVGNWGGASLVWRFEGLKDGKPVISCEKGPAGNGTLQLLPDDLSLSEGETWDATRVVMRHLDELGNLCIYSKEAVTITVEGAGSLIGPSCIPLTGGMAAFWVRTNGQSGPLHIKVRSDRFGMLTRTLDVRNS